MTPLVLAALLLAPTLPQAIARPLAVHLRVGPKTHGEGQHDHPRFLADWTRLLEARGATVTGGMEFPTEAELGACDVLVLYAAEGASIHGEERERLVRFQARGGGLVVLHDAVCGDDPTWFQGIAGGAWEHGRSKYLEGEIGLCFADREHPITRGVADFDLDDEIYWDLHLDPDAHVLANAFHTPFDITPQMWVLDRPGQRAFVSIQGHDTTSFDHPAWRTLLLRGIAWAGHRPADLLVTPEETLGLRYPPGGPLAPEHAAEALVVNPDFVLSLVAAEPLVVNPISLDWDPRGRMWVALTPGYPDRHDPGMDEIVILGDADGDGRMDTRTVFADGLDLVTSLVLVGDGVVVSQATQIVFLHDSDHDDRADERVVLYAGLGVGDTHAVVSNLRMGPDGWIWATQGYSGNQSRHVVGVDGVDHGHVGNGVLRFRTDGKAIESVLSYGNNTWGLDFDASGELFFTMANGAHLRHLVTTDRELAGGRMGGVQSYAEIVDHDRVAALRSNERVPYQQIDFVGGFTAAAGSCLYTGGVWPAEYAGDHFVCEPTVNLVHRDRLRRNGVTWTASKPRAEEFLASTDRWFRPVHTRVGPDGALYVLDFYGQAAVHNDTRGPKHGPTNAAIRPDRDHEHGRIWRVQHRSVPGTAFRPLPTEAPRLVEELDSGSGWRRTTASRLLTEHPLEPSVLAAVMERAVGGERPATRVQALWILARAAPEHVPGLLAAGLRDPDPGVRAAWLRALRGLSPWLLTRADLGPVERLFDLDARVRLEGLLTARPLFGGTDYDALLRRLGALKDDWSRSAVLAILAEHPTPFLEAVLASDPAAVPSDVVAPYLDTFARRIAQRGDVRTAVDWLTTIGERHASRPDLGALVLTRMNEMPPGEEPPWARPRLDSALVRALKAESIDLALAALPLAARWRATGEVEVVMNALGERLSGVVGDPDQAVERRLAALEAMATLPAQRAAALERSVLFLDSYFPPAVQGRTALLLADHPGPDTAAVLLGRFGYLALDARRTVQRVVLERPVWAGLLLDALEKGTVPVTELGPQMLHGLRHHPVPEIAARAATLLASFGRGERGDKDGLIAELAPRLDGRGDVDRGREVFRQNCGVCHTIEGLDVRGGVGPDLTGMGAHETRELLTFLIDPNRAVEPAFLEHVAETVDGRLVDGVIVRESDASIVLRNSTGEAELARDQVAELRSTGRSPMPAGFESLGEEALADLLAFLRGDYGAFRVIDLRPYTSASTLQGLYDRQHDAQPMRLRQRGIVDVEGVPFEVLDPARVERDALVLRGGLAAGWESHGYPQRVEIPIGYALRRLHVLGGIAAWGFPFTDRREPAVTLTWRHAGGRTEEVVLRDGEQFADWIRRHEVPGSRWVDLVVEGSAGQVRTFTVEPGDPDAVVESIVLESPDNYLAPTFLALTAQVGEDQPAPTPQAPAGVEVLLFGGGSSHDFARWFGAQDARTLEPLGHVRRYTESPTEVLAALPELRVLVLSTNQLLNDPRLRAGLLGFVERGGGLVLLHPGVWFNHQDWPEFHRELVGGGSRSHEAYAAFEVRLETHDHPLLEGLPPVFTIEDELYRTELFDDPANVVLARGVSLSTGASFPVLWTRTHGRGRIVGLTLGHDGAAHELPAFQRLLRQAVEWVLP